MSTAARILLTKLCPTEYHASAIAPYWEAFVLAIFDENRALMEYVQRLLGMYLTGDVSQQLVPIFFGEGSNGKTTLLTAVCSVLGPDYGMEANEGFLEAGGRGRHPTELADLFGKRLVVVDETEQCGQLNEARLKRLTGGNQVRGRRMNQDFWEFSPTHKLIIASNHRPTVQGNDHGVWRRIRLVPFCVQFWKPDDLPAGAAQPPAHLRADPTLPTKLKAEEAGILAWLVRGCLAWQRQGLDAPAQVREATLAYKDSQDLLTQFVEECCTKAPGSRERASHVDDAYAHWVRSLGGKPLSMPELKDRLPRLGFSYSRSNGSGYNDLRIKEIAAPGQDRSLNPNDGCAAAGASSLTNGLHQADRIPRGSARTRRRSTPDVRRCGTADRHRDRGSQAWAVRDATWPLAFAAVWCIGA